MAIFEEPAERIIEPSWNHGRYLDLWSIVHFLTGITMGLVSLILGLSLGKGLMIAVVLMVLYEGFEAVMRIIEDVQNVIMDIVVASLGFVLVYLTLPSWSGWTYGALILGVTGSNLALVRMGWNSYLKKKLSSNAEPVDTEAESTHPS